MTDGVGEAAAADVGVGLSLTLELVDVNDRIRHWNH
jgi:hypothetical protein